MSQKRARINERRFPRVLHFIERVMFAYMEMVERDARSVYTVYSERLFFTGRAGWQALYLTRTFVMCVFYAAHFSAT